MTEFFKLLVDIEDQVTMIYHDADSKKFRFYFRKFSDHYHYIIRDFKSKLFFRVPLIIENEFDLQDKERIKIEDSKMEELLNLFETLEDSDVVEVIANSKTKIIKFIFLNKMSAKRYRIKISAKELTDDKLKEMFETYENMEG